MNFLDKRMTSFATNNVRRVAGVVVGIVTNNVDDSGGYRVKVRFPWLPNGGSDGEESYWCRIATFMAGPDRGAFWLPEVNDEVLVAFDHGDLQYGFIIGALWNGTDKTILKNQDVSGKLVDSNNFVGKHEAKKNDLRAIRSRVGHQLVFNDNASEPRVALHSNQKHRIVLDDKNNEATQIEIYDGKEENYILIDTKNKKITIESKTGDMLLKCKETFTVEAKEIKMKSDQNCSMQVGKNFEMKSSSNMTIKASGTGDIESSDAMTLKGSKVNIN